MIKLLLVTRKKGSNSGIDKLNMDFFGFMVYNLVVLSNM